MKKSIVKFIQKELIADGVDVGYVDGIAGPRTITGINELEIVPMKWSTKRKLVSYIQYLAKEKGIDFGKIDGYWGPQTEYAYSELLCFEKEEDFSTWRDTMEYQNMKKSQWPKQNEDDLRAFYGEVGENQVYLDLPYKMKLSWNKNQTVTRIQIHKKVAKSCEAVLTKVLLHYGEKEIARLGLNIFGGCLNVRKMRGGSKYSTHSWGVALDFDPENNKLAWGRDQAKFSHPDYDKWWEFWEEECWVSLGRQRNFDWMHVQAAVL